MAAKKSVRQEILEDAVSLTCGDRNKQYGEPQENLDAIAGHASIYLRNKLNEDLTAQDIAMIMVFVKAERLVTTPDHWDSHVDGAAYFAIAGEVVE